MARFMEEVEGSHVRIAAISACAEHLSTCQLK